MAAIPKLSRGSGVALQSTIRRYKAKRVSRGKAPIAALANRFEPRDACVLAVSVIWLGRLLFGPHRLKAGRHQQSSALLPRILRRRPPASKYSVRAHRRAAWTAAPPTASGDHVEIAGGKTCVTPLPDDRLAACCWQVACSYGVARGFCSHRYLLSWQWARAGGMERFAVIASPPLSLLAQE